MLFTVVFLVCAGVFIYELTVQQQKDKSAEANIQRHHEAIVLAENTMPGIEAMLSWHQYYITTKNPAFLADFEKSQAAFSRNISKLNGLIHDNPGQKRQVNSLLQIFDLLSMQLEKKEAAGNSETADKKDKINNQIDLLKSNIFKSGADFITEEDRLLKSEFRGIEERKNQYYVILLSMVGVAGFLIITLNFYFAYLRTERADAAAALSEEEGVFRLAVEGTQDGVFDWDIKSGEVFYSDQFTEMLGYTPDEFSGKIQDFSDKIHPDEKEEAWEYIDLFMNGQLSEYSNTYRMQHKSGRWIWVQSRGNLILDKDGNPTRFVGANTDVSAAKEYELKLQEAMIKSEEANKAKSDFLAHMSHEIRTPLTAISGVAEILEQNSDDLDEKKRNLVRVLRSSSVTLKDVISDVLDFSKIENGELELEEKSFSLREAFEHIVSVISVRANEKNLDFSFDYEHVSDLNFYGDPIRLRQILINLLGNAVKFTQEGHVHVRTTIEDQGDFSVLRVDVKDTGIGIAKNHLDLVFEQFKQADATVSRKFGGTGLGLPISRKLAILMGGEIEVDSKLGEGSTFSLVLPMRSSNKEVNLDEQDEVRRRKRLDEMQASISDTTKVLLVEDYAGNVAVIGYLLEEMGIEFDVAKTGLEAVNLWNENHYMLILMDIQMPEMDGFTCTKLIRGMEEEKGLARVPIVGMTAHALIGDKDKCIEAGMDAYLPKPIVELDFKSVVLQFLQPQTQNQ
jgi:PAS domain S-box-containing protein